MEMKARLIQLAKLHKKIHEENAECGFSFNMHRVDFKDIPRRYYIEDGAISGRKTFKTKGDYSSSTIFSTEEIKYKKDNE